MTRKEKREIKKEISNLRCHLDDINFKLASIETSYKHIRDNYTDKSCYYGVRLSGIGFSTTMNLDADYLCNILAYAEPFLLHEKTVKENEIQRLKNKLEETK